VSLLVLIVLSAALLMAALVVSWWFAQRMKRDIESGAGPQGLGQPRTVTVPAACCANLRALSPETLLLQQGDQGLRYQVGSRPMAPAAVAPGAAAHSALCEAAAVIGGLYGERWTALVEPQGEDALKVSRLA
jgi:hypothetical protein